jgi:hypothetical protein
MIKKVTFTSGQLSVINIVLSTTKKADITTARIVRELRRRLSLRAFSRDVTELEKDLDEYGIQISWDVFAYPEDTVVQLRKRIKDETVEVERAKLEALVERVAALSTPQDFDIDELYLIGLKAFCSEKDWSKQTSTDPAGNQREIVVTVPPPLLELFADVVDKL